MNLSTTTDTELWEALRNGNEAAFNVVYHRYFDRLYEYGMRLHYNNDLIQEVIQELFIKLWTNRATLSAGVNIRPYLLVSLRGAVYNKLRTGKVQVVAFDQETHDFRAHFSAESAYIKREQLHEKQQQLLRALNQLNARQKEVIYLRYFEELDYESIADIMGITVKGVYKLSARALQSLRDIMQVSAAMLLSLLGSLRAETMH